MAFTANPLWTVIQNNYSVEAFEVLCTKTAATDDESLSTIQLPLKARGLIGLLSQIDRFDELDAQLRHENPELFYEINPEPRLEKQLGVVQEIDEILADIVHTTVSMCYQALHYEQQGKLTEAVPLLKKAIFISERVGMPDLEHQRMMLGRVQAAMGIIA